MKIVIAATCLLLLLSSSTKAAFTETKATVSNSEQVQLINQLSILANLSRKEYEQFTGRHLSLTKRILFGVNRRHLQKQLKYYQETNILPSEILNLYMVPEKKGGSNTGRTIAIVLLTILLLFLIGFLVLISKWKG